MTARIRIGDNTHKYLIIPDVPINASMPATVEIFLDAVESILLDRGTITAEQLATEYRSRILSGTEHLYNILAADDA